MLFGGAAGGGKSDCLVIDQLTDVDNRNYRGLILRRTFPMLQEIIDRAFRVYPSHGGTYKASEHRWHFPSGASIQLGHLQHENNKYDYQGKEFTKISFDELTQFTETQYLYLFSRARTTDPALSASVRATTNPGGIGHEFVKRRFIDVGPPYSTYIDPATGLSRAFIPAKLSDNPSLTLNDPGYVSRLLALPEVERLRLMDGVWDIFEGQVFSELSQRVHGSDMSPEDIPSDWPRYMVFDWGYSRPWAALWFAVDDDNTIWLYREHFGMRPVNGKYYVPGQSDPNAGVKQTNSEICKTLIDLENGRCDVNPGPPERHKMRMRIADPACWNPTKLGGSNMMHGPSFFEDAAREGLIFIKADNNRLLGLQQCHERFGLNERIDEATGEITDSRPRFVALNSCRRWWDEMQALRYDEKNVEDVDTDQPDEAYDCSRYMFLSRPVARKRRETQPEGTFQAERSKMIRAKNYARRHGCTMAEAYQRVR